MNKLIHNLISFLFIMIACLTANSVKAFSDEDSQTTLERSLPAQQKILINVPAKELHLIEDGRLVKTYKVAVGEINHPSPLGDRLLTNIVWNPWWNPPKNSEWAKQFEATPPGAANPLGPVKMNMQDLYFIHGNNDPISIGHAVTHGCVRLLDEDAIELAKRIQSVSARSMNQAAFTNALSNGEENYQITLDNPVPVDVIYDLVEVRSGKIYVYNDIYEIENQSAERLVSDELIALGVPEKKIRAQLLRRDLKSLQEGQGVILIYNRYVKNFELDQNTYVSAY
jgi:hypothetical protein